MYKEFRIDLTEAQAKKVLEGKPIRIRADQLGKGPAHYVHPENYKKLVRAYENNRGLTLNMAHGAVLRTHQSGLSGSGFWDRIWKGIKKGASAGWEFLKQNWKPLATTALDAVASSRPEAAPLRGLVKSATGLGMTKRRMRGGSFRLA